jgi:hypothetical protein
VGRWLIFALAGVVGCSSERRDPPAGTPRGTSTPVTTGDTPTAHATAPEAPREHPHDRFVRLVEAATLELEVEAPGVSAANTTRCLRKQLDDRRVGGCYRCELAHPLDVAPDVFAGLAEALDWTPRSFLRNARLERLVLCRTLTHRFGEEEPVGGTVDIEGGAIYIATDALDRRHAKNVFFHELHHLLDYARDAEDVHQDFAWRALNDEGVSYGREESRRQLGFVSTYAQRNPSEDKASTFAHMMADPNEYCMFATLEPVMLAKGKLLADRLREAVGEADTRRLHLIASCTPP